MAVVWTLLLAGALVVYHRLPPQARIYWLLFLSYAFYAWWAWPFLPVLLALTVVNYAIAPRLGPQTQGAVLDPSPASSAQADAVRARRIWLCAGIATNIGALAVLRFGYQRAPFESPFAVLGVSFYALQAVSYLVDTYSGTFRVAHRFSDLALYLAYFPKIVAGPIERPQAFFRQIAQPQVVDDARLARAATLIAVGLTRKVVLADPLAARLPAAAFTAPGTLGSLTLLTAAVGYTFVLYNDFAAYSAIARGVSLLFGIELSANFAEPFAAHSFANFWNRWHMTLSYWLRDYIYLPVSRRLLRGNLSRWNVANLLVPPLLTMLVSGLWHGLSLHMLVWGGLHGCYLVVERVLGMLWPTRGRLPPWRRACGIALQFTLRCWTIVVFRLPVVLALQFWRQLLTGSAGDLPDARVLLYLLPSVWLDWMQARHGEDTMFLSWPRLARVGLLAAALLLWITMYGGAAPTPFVYQGF